MSEYPAGTVAMVTSFETRRKAIAAHQGYWHRDDGRLLRPDDVTDITPLVCIEATREDADLIAKNLRVWSQLEPEQQRAWDALQRILSTIREQTPEPLDLPENLGAVVEQHGRRWVCLAPGTPMPWRQGVISGSSGWIAVKPFTILSRGVEDGAK